MGICLSLLARAPLSTLPAHVIGLMLKGRGLVEVEWEGSGVVRRLSGVVTIDDLDVSAAQIQGDERIDRLRYGIHDFRDAIDIDVLDDDIEFMAMRAVVALERNVVIRIAFVGDHPVNDIKGALGAGKEERCSGTSIKQGSSPAAGIFLLAVWQGIGNQLDGSPFERGKQGLGHLQHISGRSSYLGLLKKGQWQLQVFYAPAQQLGLIAGQPGHQQAKVFFAQRFV